MQPLSAPPTSAATVRILTEREAAEAIRTRKAWGELWQAIAREHAAAQNPESESEGDASGEAA
jgi:hypothetical protein